ncbi:hypothetical protein NDN11_05850 [Acinetobacter sp. C26M]|uniref:hypothetical protein n=1 Tax=unclassified Acinetobacter TaxID=196816 RepID=UPI002036A76B|nr:MULTISPECIES: hypothetical protein [unclassified Acinetobacter]USA47637.1 hypothetical protein NDN11_05850 [Acinetobacter sp. C26M]USA51118.1 hypothetical protein NDN12_05850 [Acinetobacter sp. C26G]
MSKPNQDYRYRISKRMFKYYNQENHNMLFGIGRMLCNAPFSNVFSQNIFPIKNKHRKIDIDILKQVLIPYHLDYFYNNIHSDLSAEHITHLHKNELQWDLEVFESTEINLYIAKQLTNTLHTLQSTENLEEIFQYGIEYISWKLTDNLTFMNNDWSIKFPTWKCEISSPYYKYHLLIMQLTHGLVVTSFCFPVLKSSQ